MTLKNHALRFAAFALIGALAMTSAGCLYLKRWQWSQMVLPGEQEPDQSTEILVGEYYPFSSRPPYERQNPLLSLRQPPTLQIDRDYPRLDGATSFFPIYATAAGEIYRAETEAEKLARRAAVNFSRTPRAYGNLIRGQADMVFALAPSSEQKKKAAEAGLSLRLTPIAKEAFVFIVNEHNPVRELSLEAVRAIYSGEISNWKAVGGLDEEIIPFQRPDDSGSQSIMLQEVMRGTPIRKPFMEETRLGMGILLYSVAGYRSRLTNALGYSFHFYATRMNPVAGVRLLAINGVAPTPENIRNQSYPLLVDVYMVTARPLSENTQKLHDWFLSAEGQQLIEAVGYTPLRPPQNSGEHAGH
ncbi:MAG: substrate-binding domain-containing protein [Zoogloeaceae bacterium]|nr:substrate-binding domain-containing protein [Zoogloeaceae bacterium]